MPEHRCRIREPSDFQKESFRRIVQGKLGIVIGKLTGKTTTTTQAFRYPTDKWTLESARKHCQEHEGKFDPATEERLTDTNVDRIAETNARHAAIRMYARKFGIEMTEDDLNKPFGIYDNMDECISLNLDKPDALEFCMNIKKELESDITQNPEVKPLPVQESNIRIFETVNSLMEAMHGNKFKWIPDIDRLKEVSRSSSAKLILVTALHEMTTDPKNKGHGAREFSKNELMKSVYTALGKGLNINHNIPLNKNFTHKILDGDYNEDDDSLEYILMDNDPEILHLIREEYITNVSMQGDPRRQPTKCDKCGTKDCNCRMHPEAIIWGEKDGIAMAYVVSKDGATYHGQPVQAEKPGDPKSRITIMETITEGYIASGSLKDSDFAYVPEGEHALSARKLPIFTKDRTVTSLRRFAVTLFPNDSAKASTQRKLCEAAKKFGITSDLCESNGANKSLKDTERTNAQMNTRELLLTLTQDAKVKESIEHPDRVIMEQTDLDLYNKALEEGNTVDAYNIINGYTHPDELEAMLSEEMVEAIDEQGGTVRIQPVTQPLRSQFPGGTGRGRFLFSPTKGARLFPQGLTLVEKIKEKLIKEAEKKVAESKTGQISTTEANMKTIVDEVTKKINESLETKVKEIFEKESKSLKESMQNLSSHVKETMQETKKKSGNLPVHTVTETLQDKSGISDVDSIERRRNILRSLTP